MQTFKEYLEENNLIEKAKGLDGKPCWDGYKLQGSKKKGKRTVDNCVKEDDTSKRGDDSKGHKRPTEDGAGLTAKGVAAHRRANPGSKLKTAVTGKVKAGSKSAKRRKSFCARMGGMEGPMKDEKGRPTRKAQSLKRWRC